MKDFGSEVFSSGSVANTANEEIIDAFEIKLVEGFEFRGISLSGLDEQTFVHALRRRLLCRTSDSYHGSGHSNCRAWQKVTRRRFFEEMGRPGAFVPLGASPFS
jgi:hypothetical protein